MFYRSFLSTAILAVLATSAHAVKLENVTLNGQPYVEGMTVYGATSNGAGKYNVTIAGKLSVEDKDWNTWKNVNQTPDPVGDNKWDPSRFQKNGGIQGAFAIGTDECKFPIYNSNGFDYPGGLPNLRISQFAIDKFKFTESESRCFALFEATGKLYTDSNNGPNIYDITYGFGLKFHTSEDGTFNKVIPTKLGSNVLSYQLPSAQPYREFPSGGDIWKTQISLKFSLSDQAPPADFRRSFSSQVNGMANARNIQAQFRGDSKYLGQTAQLYIAAKVTAGNTDTWFFLSGNNWQAWDLNIDHLAPVQSLTLSSSFTTLPILENIDLRNYSGSEIWIAYKPQSGALDYEKIYTETGN
ncbi:hypothetical protein [Parachitinimonas caeni]|uniref:Uncharacterized protein n=1 Tax=Parachitinimonas caeni TaxID=3031301 RepID=A0ABT7DZK6_9NEIS|nr:hypothetical protein [Parachitinimonas caeni]MDK2125493.1 hypothetical protein [Parachitinimonas caeni]